MHQPLMLATFTALLINVYIIEIYSQLSPCLPRYYGQNLDPRQVRLDWKLLPLLRTLANKDTKRRPARVSATTRVDCGDPEAAANLFSF